jgi:predicted O-methyltransferase YrrM
MNRMLLERLQRIEARGSALGFELGSPPYVGEVLRVLAVAKPGGRLLEIGTGTGIATAWLLDGMDERSSLVSVDNDSAALAVAAEVLGEDRRLRLVHADGEDFIKQVADMRFDLIFADSIPGKHVRIAETLDLLRDGGFYVVDDMRARTDRASDHPMYPDRVRRYLRTRPDLHLFEIPHSTELIVAAKRPRMAD